MSIQPVSKSEYTTANREWPASLHGTDSVVTITLDLNLFTEGMHYVCGDGCEPYGRVLSGVPVGRVAESGLYGPYDPEAPCGRQVLRGFVIGEAPFAPGQTWVPAALLWHGVVKASKVPGGIDVSELRAVPGTGFDQQRSGDAADGIQDSGSNQASRHEADRDLAQEPQS